MNLNDIQSGLFDMYDIRRAVPRNIQNQPKDSDGTETPIGECIESVIQLLENLEQDAEIEMKGAEE